MEFRQRMVRGVFWVLLVLWTPTLRDNVPMERLVIWNVGQGQWVSYISSTSCHHFDAGGEIFPRSVLEACLGKENRLSISHWDFDHISFLFEARRRGLDFCTEDLPSDHHRWKKFIQQWRICESPMPSFKTFDPMDFAPKRETKKTQRNDRSLVFKGSIRALHDRRLNVLITGDAPAKMENELHRLMSLKDIDVLVVGHHGSITSSSEKFLNRMSRLQMAFVSARQGKYGHPHPVVVSRFKRMRVPLLSTEDWGHLVVELK